MPTELTAEINTRNLERMIRLFPEKLKYELGDAMDHIGRKFLGRFRRERLKGKPGVMGHRQSGLFGRFYRASLVSNSIEGMGMIIFTDSKIARLHEEGGVLSDPSGGKLAVPLSARTEMFTSEGKLRKAYRDVPKMWLNKKLIRLSIHNRTYLAKRQNRNKQSLPLFVLKNRIRIRPRLRFYDTWNSMQNERINILNNSVSKTINNVK